MDRQQTEVPKNIRRETESAPLYQVGDVVTIAPWAKDVTKPVLGWADGMMDRLVGETHPIRTKFFSYVKKIWIYNIAGYTWSWPATAFEESYPPDPSVMYRGRRHRPTNESSDPTQSPKVGDRVVTTREKVMYDGKVIPKGTPGTIIKTATDRVGVIMWVEFEGYQNNNNPTGLVGFRIEYPDDTPYSFEHSLRMVPVEPVYKARRHRPLNESGEKPADVVVPVGTRVTVSLDFAEHNIARGATVRDTRAAGKVGTVVGHIPNHSQGLTLHLLVMDDRSVGVENGVIWKDCVEPSTRIQYVHGVMSLPLLVWCYGLSLFPMDAATMYRSRRRRPMNEGARAVPPPPVGYTIEQVRTTARWRGIDNIGTDRRGRVTAVTLYGTQSATNSMATAARLLVDYDLGRVEQVRRELNAHNPAARFLALGGFHRRGREEVDTRVRPMDFGFLFTHGMDVLRTEASWALTYLQQKRLFSRVVDLIFQGHWRGGTEIGVEDAESIFRGVPAGGSYVLSQDTLCQKIVTNNIQRSIRNIELVLRTMTTPDSWRKTALLLLVQKYRPSHYNPISPADKNAITRHVREYAATYTHVTDDERGAMIDYSMSDEDILPLMSGDRLPLSLLINRWMYTDQVVQAEDIVVHITEIQTLPPARLRQILTTILTNMCRRGRTAFPKNLGVLRDSGLLAGPVATDILNAMVQIGESRIGVYRTLIEAGARTTGGVGYYVERLPARTRTYLDEAARAQRLADAAARQRRRRPV